MNLPPFLRDDIDLPTHKALIILVFGFLVLLIAFQKFGLMPFSLFFFTQFVLYSMFVATARPRWMFWIFLAVIPFETFVLSPDSFPLGLRAYQIFGMLALFGYVFNYLWWTKKTYGFPELFRRLPSGMSRVLKSLHSIDVFVGIFVLSGWVSCVFLGSADGGRVFLLNAITTSFGILYVTVRLFLSSRRDVVRAMPFVLASAVVVMGWAVIENILSIHFGIHSSVMSERPNASFYEADWLGMYTGVFLSIILAILYFFEHPRANYSLKRVFWYECVMLAILVVIITVARSAWLGVFAVISGYILAQMFRARVGGWKHRIKHVFLSSVQIGMVSLLAFGLVWAFNLSNFNLKDRLESTGSHKQEITIACASESTPPNTIANIDELSAYSCEHIDLEDIDWYKAQGFLIATTYRDDPNVGIRMQIWSVALENIYQHPIFGIGWGAVSNQLGTDERGADLNASNIFLETWLGSGFFGILSLISICICLFWGGIRLFLRGKENLQNASWSLVVLLGGVAIIVPNLFNSGQFLGFFWVWLAMSVSVLSTQDVSSMSKAKHYDCA